jgi:antitoxin (DNA-binding transcriptional repressor) of toxin-antitoxin stability system
MEGRPVARIGPASLAPEISLPRAASLVSEEADAFHRLMTESIVLATYRN